MKLVYCDAIMCMYQYNYFIDIYLVSPHHIWLKRYKYPIFHRIYIGMHMGPTQTSLLMNYSDVREKKQNGRLFN